jgi:hypothetical protein
VQSNLQLSEAPVANTGRYDSLRGLSDTDEGSDEGTESIVEVDHAA